MAAAIKSREEAIRLADYCALALVFDGIEYPTETVVRMPGYISHDEARPPAVPEGHRWTRCIVTDARRPNGDRCHPRLITVYEDGVAIHRFTSH